jgi:hypothetical protein
MNIIKHRTALGMVLVLNCLVCAGQAVEDGKKDKATGALYTGGGLRGVAVSAPDGWLVSSAEAVEFKGEEGFNEPAALRPRAVVPLIDILKPEAGPDNRVKTPFPITVVFKGQSDTAIDPGTFKVLYGALKVDITSRITKFVKVSKDGFTLDNAQIPQGKHRLTLQVQDEKQRMAERELRVEVE